MILYSNNCPKCEILKKKLDEASLQYEIINDMEVFIEKGFRMMPMLEIDGEILDFGKAIKKINIILKGE